MFLINETGLFFFLFLVSEVSPISVQFVRNVW